MPVVPFAPQAPKAPQLPQVAPEFMAMAAAGMEQAGRLFQPEVVQPTIQLPPEVPKEKK